MLEKWNLAQRQSLPLAAKVRLTEVRIRDWYSHWRGQVYVSFSGGKDSAVLLNIVRRMYPHVKGVFVDTGLEYPEIRDFVKTFDNIEWLRPKKSFKQVLEDYGYPIVSKEVARYLRDLQNPTPNNEQSRSIRLTGYNLDGKDCKRYKLPDKWHYLIDAPFRISEQCCKIMKTGPLVKYEKESGLHPIIGIMACESGSRTRNYMKFGCNAFALKNPISRPMAFWMQQDVLRYIKENDIPYCPIYGDIVENEKGELVTTGETRTGCIFCMFGIHMREGENRFQRLERTHPKLHKYCMEKLGMKEVMEFMGYPWQCDCGGCTACNDRCKEPEEETNEKTQGNQRPVEGVQQEEA